MTPLLSLPFSLASPKGFQAECIVIVYTPNTSKEGEAPISPRTSIKDVGLEERVAVHGFGSGLLVFSFASALAGGVYGEVVGDTERQRNRNVEHVAQTLDGMMELGLAQCCERTFQCGERDSAHAFIREFQSRCQKHVQQHVVFQWSLEKDTTIPSPSRRGGSL